MKRCFFDSRIHLYGKLPGMFTRSILPIICSPGLKLHGASLVLVQLASSFSEAVMDLDPWHCISSSGVHLQPLCGVDLVRAQDGPDVVVQDLCSSAWQRPKPSVTQACEVGLQRHSQCGCPLPHLQRAERVHLSLTYPRLTSELPISLLNDVKAVILTVQCIFGLNTHTQIHGRPRPSCKAFIHQVHIC